MELEICVDSVASALAAEAGGADRVELCCGLLEGGLTPSLGLLRAVRAAIGIGIHVMIRPRGGDFVYSEEELAVMREDIRLTAEAGAEGVVLGVLTADGDVDVPRTRELVELARGSEGRRLEVTFHRALDMTRDMEGAFEDVVLAGADRVLTSGGEETAMLGRARLRWMAERAGGRIHVAAGGGVRPENVRELMEATGVVEFHAALRSAIESPVREPVRRVHLGHPEVDDYARSGVRAEDVRRVKGRAQGTGLRAQ